MSKRTKIVKMEDGMCFKNATMHAIKIDGEVVHGTVMMRVGRRDHAWIEKGDEVIDPTVGLVTTKAKYYEAFEAQPEARYSFVEASRNMIQHRHHGPWHKSEAAQ